MCRRLSFWTCLVLLLSMAGNVSAQLLARYQFDETSGTIAVDSSIKGNDGTIGQADPDIAGGDPNWVEGWTNGALGFDGNLGVTLPAENMGLRSDAGSVAFWMNLPVLTGGINTIWWGGDNTTGGGFGAENETHIHIEAFVTNIWDGGELAFHGQNNPNFHLFSDPNKGNVAGSEPNSPILLNDGQWHHVVCTWGNDDGNVKMYLEGALLHEGSQGTRSYPLSNMYLGQMANGGRTYRGLLDDVQIYGRALTPAEILDIMAGGAALTLQASLPLPANKAVEVPRDSVLSWTTGDTGVKHNVYFGTYFNDVSEASLTDQRGILLSIDQDELSFDPPDLLEYGRTYYWRIDEVEADGTTIQKGAVWSFTSVNFRVVDNFEDYDDVNNIVYNTWDDYFVNNTGMTVGHLEAPSIEQSIVNSGTQAMPLRFDNDGTVNEGTELEATGTLFYSEAEHRWASGQDWTRDGVESLTLWFRGNAAKVSSFLEDPAGIYTIGGSGTDIWGAVDEFHFAYQEIASGKVTIIAKIESLDNTDPFAKAGVMIRDTLEPGARNGGVFVTPQNGTRFQRRMTADAAYADSEFVSDVNDPNWAPNWVKIERASGGMFRTFYSEDGSNWDSFTLRIISMQFPIYVGLAVTSHNADAVCEAVFSNVSIMVDDTPSNQSLTAQDIGINSNDPQRVYVAVNDDAVVYHEDPNASLIKEWTRWNIPLQEFTNRGANLTNVNSFSIGVGERNAAEPDGSGDLYIDDIRLYRPPVPMPLAVENYSFELPGTVKIRNWEEVPGWNSDTAPSDSGVESAGPRFPPSDGDWSGFLMGSDPSVWQLTNHIVQAGAEYILTVDAENNSGATQMVISLFYDDGSGNRIAAASQTVDLLDGNNGSGHDTQDKVEFTLSLSADDVPEAIGNNLGIELDNPADGYLGLDNVRLIILSN